MITKQTGALTNPLMSGHSSGKVLTVLVFFSFNYPMTVSRCKQIHLYLRHLLDILVRCCGHQRATGVNAAAVRHINNSDRENLRVISSPSVKLFLDECEHEPFNSLIPHSLLRHVNNFYFSSLRRRRRRRALKQECG